MFFRMGKRRFRVRISDGPLFNEKGELCGGLFSWVEKTIWISGIIPLSERPRMLIHELKHAWHLYKGVPLSAEDDANQAADFFEEVLDQYDRQGGALTLIRLTAEGIIDHTIEMEEGEDSTHLGAECAECGTKFGPFQVQQGNAFVHEATGKRGIKRWIDCDFCSKLQVWVEACNKDSRATGNILQTPKHLQGTERQLFLARHQAKTSPPD